MAQDHAGAISKSALLFLSGTFLSRCSGLVRDMAMAFCFGSHPAVAAFMVAFRFANLFRRLFGEGALSASFIPHFESFKAEAPRQGASFFRDFFASLALLLFLIVLGVEIALGVLLKGGMMGNQEHGEILSLSLRMLPGIPFVCLFALTSALLQCEKKFFLSGLAPASFNVVWIGALFWFQKCSPEEGMRNLSFAIIAAFFVQWLVTVPGVWRILSQSVNWKSLFKVKLFSPEIRTLFRPFVFSSVGIGAVQINGVLDALFARFASPEGPAYLWYAIRLEQVPLALFGIALSSALLPPLSRSIQEGRWQQGRELLIFGLKSSLNLMLPCTFALFALGAVSINLLYGRGDFTERATLQTVISLWGYALGLIPSVFVLLIAPAFYAQKDYRTPMIASSYAVLLNIALNTLMVFFLHWGPFSVAMATSISAFFNCWMLSRALSRRMGPILYFGFFSSAAKGIASTLIAGAGSSLLGYLLFGDCSLQILMGAERAEFVRSFPDQLTSFSVMAGAFCALFLLSAKLLNAKEILQLMRSELETRK
jgi:putative peptidoglycan lipid II flippase